MLSLIYPLSSSILGHQSRHGRGGGGGCCSGGTCPPSFRIDDLCSSSPCSMWSKFSSGLYSLPLYQDKRDPGTTEAEAGGAFISMDKVGLVSYIPSCPRFFLDWPIPCHCNSTFPPPDLSPCLWEAIALYLYGYGLPSRRRRPHLIQLFIIHFFHFFVPCHCSMSNSCQI